MTDRGPSHYASDKRCLTLQPEGGEAIDAFAARMVAHAWINLATVLGQFNQYTLEARPGMTREDVMQPWDDAQYLSRFGKERPR